MAAVWAAEIMDEKKLADGVLLGPLTGGLSTVGDSGAKVVLESLLGPGLAELDLVLLWAIRLPHGEGVAMGEASEPGSCLTGGGKATDPCVESVGVLTTISGVDSLSDREVVAVVAEAVVAAVDGGCVKERRLGANDAAAGRPGSANREEGVVKVGGVGASGDDCFGVGVGESTGVSECRDSDGWLRAVEEEVAVLVVVVVVAVVILLSDEVVPERGAEDVMLSNR